MTEENGMTNEQLNKVLKMVEMIADGCESLEDFKEKLTELQK